MTCQFAFAGDSAAQYTANGVCASMKITTGFGQLVTYALDGIGRDLHRPECAGDRGHVRHRRHERAVHLQGGDGAPRGVARARDGSRVRDAGSRLPNDWKPVRDPNGTETINSMVNVAGRPRGDAQDPAALRLRAGDRVHRGDRVQLLRVGAPTGAARPRDTSCSTCRNVKIVSKPKPVKVDERFYLDLELGALRDDTVTVAAEAGRTSISSTPRTAPRSAERTAGDAPSHE